jgi:glycosyltransferase involved in cell wall biosynthesis
MVKYAMAINIWNESNKVGPLFDQIENQTKPPDLWIWIDDGSTDDSVTTIRRKAADSPIPVIILRAPKKKKGNYDTIGKAWNYVLDEIQKLEGYDYLMITDADCRFPQDYAERMLAFMNSHPKVGVAAGQVRGELRHHMPMNAGKVIRWDIVESIGRFWDIVPDTFWNITALSMGYEIANRRDIKIDAAPSRGFSRRGRFRYGRLMYYVNRSIFLVILQAAKFQVQDGTGTPFLKGYISEWLRGTWKCDIQMVRRFYSLPVTIMWRLCGRF